MKSPNNTLEVWFPVDKKRIFHGRTLDAEQLIVNATTFEDGYFIEQRIKERGSIVMQANTLDDKKFTAIASFLGSASNTNFVTGGHTAEYKFDIRFIFYGEHFFDQDVKFSGIIINFVNLSKWISEHEITYGDNNAIRREITLSLNDAYSIKFLYQEPISDDDKETTNRIGHNVYIRIDSKVGDISYEKLFEQKNTLQDFLNFVVTDKGVYSKSIYGVIKDNNQEKLVRVRHKAFSGDKMNKCRVRTPVLFHSHEFGEPRIEQLLRKWYEFKEFHRIIYNHYFESIYRMDAIELSYFKLVTFLEGYHRELWELNHPSPIRSLKHTYFNSIMRMLEEIEIDNTDKKVVNTILKQNKELTLAQRLKEIFEYYSDIVSISGPVVSFFDNARLNKLIQEIVMDKVISYKLTEIINLKNEADSEIIQEIRKQKYQRILEFLNSESPNVGHSLLLFVKFVLMEQFPKEFAKYRNTMAHLLARDYQRIGINRWFYGLKILQLTAQLCVLSLLGFTHKEIRAIFFLDSIDDRIKLEVMIKSNIDLETYVT